MSDSQAHRPQNSHPKQTIPPASIVLSPASKTTSHSSVRTNNLNDNLGKRFTPSSRTQANSKNTGLLSNQRANNQSTDSKHSTNPNQSSDPNQTKENQSKDTPSEYKGSIPPTHSSVPPVNQSISHTTPVQTIYPFQPGNPSPTNPSSNHSDNQPTSRIPQNPFPPSVTRPQPPLSNNGGSQDPFGWDDWGAGGGDPFDDFQGNLGGGAGYNMGGGGRSSGYNQSMNSPMQEPQKRLTPEERITMIESVYQEILGRKPDTRDINYYKYSTLNEDQIKKQLLASAEHKDILSKGREFSKMKDHADQLETRVHMLEGQIKDQIEEFRELTSLLQEKNRHLHALRSELSQKAPPPSTLGGPIGYTVPSASLQPPANHTVEIPQPISQHTTISNPDSSQQYTQEINQTTYTQPVISKSELARITHTEEDYEEAMFSNTEHQSSPSSQTSGNTDALTNISSNTEASANTFPQQSSQVSNSHYSQELPTQQQTTTQSSHHTQEIFTDSSSALPPASPTTGNGKDNKDDAISAKQLLNSLVHRLF